MSERFIVVKVGDLICINIYLPCRGTPDRDLLCKEVLDNVLYWRSEHPSCCCIIGGDFNIDLDCVSSRSYMHDVINSFLTCNNLTRCDLGFTPSVSYTYANESQNYYSKLLAILSVTELWLLILTLLILVQTFLIICL